MSNKINTTTPQELIDLTINKVETVLTKHFPDFISFGDGRFTITKGSAQVLIIVHEFTATETAIECIAQVVTGANITPELMTFLLRKNVELHFGAFGMLFDNTITFSHCITGINMDEDEFVNTLKAVAVIADYYDDKIVEIAGGKRAQDLYDDLLI